MKKIAIFLSVVIICILAAGLAFPKRRSLVLERAKGRLRVAHGCTVFTPGIFEDEERFLKTRGLIREKQRDGALALYDTPIGPIWYRATAWTLPALVQENQADEYHLRSTIKPGDIVLDVGANVGTDSRAALAAGAARVVAIEPEPVSLECLRRNLAQEIRDHRVEIVPKGAWNKDDTLTLHVDETNAGASNFFVGNGKSIVVPLTTIDRMVAELNLPKVDLIKMDIEGSEQNALLGAAETIRRYHPRLAIVLEHNVNDVDVLPAVARRFWPGYHLTVTPCTKTFDLIHPEAALLSP